MVIDAVGIEPYEWSSVADTGEQKTVFVIKPLLIFESMKIGGLFQEFLDETGGENANMGAFIKAFASPKAELFAKALEDFITEKVMEIKNIKIEGKIENVTGDFIKENPNIIPVNVAFEMLSNSLQRINPTQEEAGN